MPGSDERESVGPTTPIELVEAAYAKYPKALGDARRRLGRPLTFAEKIMFAHADDPATIGLERGVDYADYRPDRVAMQDATAQMALLQFMTAGLPRVQVPSTVHCDHLIQARVGADIDLKNAIDVNSEVYEFLRTVSAKYGIGFWKPGSGIIHQVVLEQYAFPGGMMLGTDSHTPNAGGLGMVAIGVGGADAVDVMAGWPFNTRVPKVIGVRLTGALSGWAAAKDVILKVAGILTVKGGTGAIVEYFGPGTESISATGKATICNMGAEIGATCSLFPYDHHAAAYLKATGREALADLADAHAEHLRVDPEVLAEPERFYDRVIDIDLDELEPHLVGPHTPDLDRPISDVGRAAREEGYPLDISYALVGSCTNSSYEDIGRAAHVARQASAAGITVKTPLLITPGSEQVRATIERDGLLDDLEAIGATVLANACGPCIGQWQRDDIVKGETNTIVSSFNRNFPARNDGNASTLSFIGSPETVTAMALTGRLDVDFVREPIVAPDGTLVQLEAPVADQLPVEGLRSGRVGLQPARCRPRERDGRGEPDVGSSAAARAVRGVGRQRLRGAARADEGGGQVHHRPHLARRTVAQVPRPHRQHLRQPLHRGEQRIPPRRGGHRDRRARWIGGVVARSRAAYKGAGIAWVAIGDENYGEGSSREHAAMEPRFQNGKAVIVRSFAAHPRGEPEEAGRACAHVREPERLRAGAGRRHGRHRRSRRPRAGRAGHGAPAPRQRQRRRDRHHPHDERRAHRLVPRRLRAQRASRGLSAASSA